MGTRKISQILYKISLQCNDNGGVIDARMMMVWKCPIPLKVKIFVWMAVHDRFNVEFS